MEFVIYGIESYIISRAQLLSELVEKHGFELDWSGRMEKWPKSNEPSEDIERCYHLDVIALTPGLEMGKALLLKVRRIRGIRTVCPKCSKLPIGERSKAAKPPPALAQLIKHETLVMKNAWR
jgi:hypothetical protein